MLRIEPPGGSLGVGNVVRSLSEVRLCRAGTGTEAVGGMLGPGAFHTTVAAPEAGPAAPEGEIVLH